MSRLAAVFLLIFTVSAGAQSVPTTGRADPDLAPFDDLMRNFMLQNQVPGGALAVARHGRLIYARGFGWADKDTRQTVEPNALFRIASVSKPFTAVALLHLIDQGKITLDAHPFPLLALPPAAQQNFIIEKRLADITLLELLQHRGGFDRDQSVDPMFRSVEFATIVGKPAPAMPEDIIRVMEGRSLDFAPGERYAYSNFGYCVLGRVIEHVTHKPYEQYVKEEILAPLNIHDMRLGHTLFKDRAPNEVHYYTAKNATGSSVFKGGPLVVRVPYGAWCIEAMDAHGGWLASAPDLVRFASALTAPGEPPLLPAQTVDLMFARPPGAAGLQGNKPDGKPAPVWYGCGWSVRDVGNHRINTWHTGLLAGTASLLVRRSDGLDWAVVFNQDSNEDGKYLMDLMDPLVHKAADAVKHWPEGLGPGQPWP